MYLQHRQFGYDLLNKRNGKLHQLSLNFNLNDKTVTQLSIQLLNFQKITNQSLTLSKSDKSVTNIFCYKPNGTSDVAS